jgi:cytochrome c5
VLFRTLVLLCAATCAFADEATDAKKRWEESPYGPLLERILPPTFEARELPEPQSEGARLVQRYCVQCHNLPNPAMHHAAKWRPIVERMAKRMRGGGNMGRLMADMMAGVQAPSPQEQAALVAYLRRHGQKPLDPARYPDVALPAAEPFRLACSQCHVLPDPRRHTAKEWPGVVARMEQNMQWMNRVVGSHPDPDEPQLRVEAILDFLQRHARP